MRRIVFAIALAVLCVFGVASASALPVTLAWDPNPPAENVVAYRVYTSPTAAGPFTQVKEVTATQATLEVALAPICFAVTAVNGLGLQSDYSNRLCVDMAKPGSVNAFRIEFYVPRIQ